MTLDVPRTLQTRPAGVRGLDDYARACRRVGQSVLLCGGTWWREVRPCFFRPMLPFLDAPGGAAGLPRRSALGGCQYPARPGTEAPNSSLAYLGFLDAAAYSIDALSPRLRSYVRSASRRFEVRPLAGAAEMKACAHRSYLEFQRRTNYHYLESRVRKPVFDRWCDAEFADAGLVALGAWDRTALVAVSLSRVVGDAWLYSSFFASNDALHAHVANLMLHHARSMAAATGQLSLVFVGMPKTGDDVSVDEFYVRRGAVVVRRPAVLRVNPLVRWALSRLAPAIWRGLQGAGDAGAPDGTPAP